MTLHKRNRLRRHSGDAMAGDDVADDSYGLSPSESLEERWTGSHCSSDGEGKAKSRIVGGVLKKFARRNKFGKSNCGEFLDGAYSVGTQDRSDNNSAARTIPLEHDLVPDSEGNSEQSSLKRDGTVSQCEKTMSTKQMTNASASLAHEGAVATLVAMFEPPWSENLLGEVLLLNDYNLTKSVDMIISHGGQPPEELVQSLSGKEVAGENTIPFEKRSDSVNIFPNNLVHNLGDDVSAITVESSMEFSWRERVVKPSETCSHLPSIQDEEYSIEGEIMRYRHQDEALVVEHSGDNQENICTEITLGSLNNHGESRVESANATPGIRVVKLALDEREPTCTSHDMIGSSATITEITERERGANSFDQNINDDNTVGRLEAKVMRLAGTLGPGQTANSMATSLGEGSMPSKAILLAVPQTESSTDAYQYHRSSQHGHETDVGYLKTENAALKSHVKELTEKLATLQDTMERMLTTQEQLVNSVMKQRGEMETVLSDTSVARHCEI